MPIRIVLADDHYLVREGVAALVATEPDLELVATCEDHDQTLVAVEAHRPDVLVTDIRMPPTGTDEGVRIAARLRQDHPGIGVVVLSQYVEPAYALDLLEGGSAGRAYLLKERVSDIDELVAAVRAVAGGGSWIDPKVVEALVSSRSTPADSPLHRLTPRELEVLSEIAAGKNNAAIAASLVLSGRAVEKHINSIFSKLGLSEETTVHRRVAAVLLFLGDAA
ncbi:MAG TPA: response regulator transcription factor [Acidimicrobiales bacterium]|nr:response regulator transcription factor [Acidimicrobiales bacterium]